MGRLLLLDIMGILLKGMIRKAGESVRINYKDDELFCVVYFQGISTLAFEEEH